MRASHVRYCGMFAAALLALAPFTSAGGHPSVVEHPSAVEQFQQFQQNLKRDKSQEDWQTYLQDARRLKLFLNGSPTSRLEVARAQLQLGHPGQASVEIRQFLAMGQAHDILQSPLFAPLKSTVEEPMKSNRSAVSVATPAWYIWDPQLLPEDIDYDPRSKRFFVTSVLQDRVVVLDERGKQTVFAEAPDHWPMLAIKVDSHQRRLWATEVAMDGFDAVPKTAWGRSVLLEYDLDNGTLLARYVGPAHGNLGDMVLAGDGGPVVSDGEGGGIYRLRAHQLERIDHGEFISPQTIAICGDDHHAFVPDYVRGVAMFDLDTGAVRWLATKNRYALNGIDGLYCHDRLLVAIQNGTAPQRVISFRLDPSRSSIVAERIVERSTSTLGDPTHGVFVAKTFYYIANSGWDVLDEHGTVKSPGHLTPGLIMSVPVQ
jgi:hypothetical protein